YGYRAKRDAQQASLARREDLYTRAWGVAERDFKASFTSLPPGQLLKLTTTRRADGSLLKLSKQPLKGGITDQGPVVPTPVGVAQGSPISPLYRTSYLNRLDQRWHSRGSPVTRGATRHREAEDAIVGCRRRPQPALVACEAIATRMALPRKRDKTRVTRPTEGFEVIGFTFVTRKSPSSGKNTIDIFAA